MHNTAAAEELRNRSRRAGEKCLHNNKNNIDRVPLTSDRTLIGQQKSKALLDTMSNKFCTFLANMVMHCQNIHEVLKLAKKPNILTNCFDDLLSKLHGSSWKCAWPWNNHLRYRPRPYVYIGLHSIWTVNYFCLPADLKAKVPLLETSLVSSIDCSNMHLP